MVIGLPNKYIQDVFKNIKQHKRDMNSKETFDWLKEDIDNKIEIVNKYNNLILNLYPDCLHGQMKLNDPRYNCLDEPRISKFPEYAFPLGFDIKYQANQPANELLPMMYIAGEEKLNMQYLIFYESLDEAYFPAEQLYQDVLDEMASKSFETNDPPSGP